MWSIRPIAILLVLAASGAAQAQDPEDPAAPSEERTVQPPGDEAEEGRTARPPASEEPEEARTVQPRATEAPEEGRTVRPPAREASEEASAKQAPTFLAFEELPAPSLSLERLPPRYSYEFALSISYGTVTYWSDYFPAWIGFGLRGGWGRNFGNSRVGFDVQVVAEGPVGVHTTLGLEPHLSWDHITREGVLFGAGIGPALLYHASAGPSVALKGVRDMTFGPSAVARIGWSQSWSRVGRRLFVAFEPKMRIVNGTPNPVGALVVGSGLGR